MENNFEHVIDQISNFMRDEAKTETVVGESFRLGQYDCIPVISVGMGFGTGGGEGEDEKDRHGSGIGAGAGMGISPIGFLVAKDDQITFVSTKANKGISAAFEKVPDLINKFLDTQKVQEAEAV